MTLKQLKSDEETRHVKSIVVPSLVPFRASHFINQSDPACPLALFRLHRNAAVSEKCLAIIRLLIRMTATEKRIQTSVLLAVLANVVQNTIKLNQAIVGPRLDNVSRSAKRRYPVVHVCCLSVVVVTNRLCVHSAETENKGGPIVT